MLSRGMPYRGAKRFSLVALLLFVENTTSLGPHFRTQYHSLARDYSRQSTGLTTSIMELSDFEKWCLNKAQRVKNPSKRTPDSETDFNDADNVERQLAEDGHKIWGWVIYRCTYENDEEWTEFMHRLRYYIEDTLQFYNALDMLSSLDYQVFDNRETFDKVHPSVVREHFEQWTATAPEQEQGEGKSEWDSQRYNYCIHVDQEALQSVISGPAPPADNLGDGFVNLVCRDGPNVWGGMKPEHTDDRDERDLCWMRITYYDLMVGWYNLLRRQASWFNEYRIPPEVGSL